MTGEAWSGLVPAEVAVRCAGERHTLRWAEGRLTALDHPDPDRERALVALGAEPYRCLHLLDLWNAHADDLDVLVLAGRGVGDDLPVHPDRSDTEDAAASGPFVGVRSGRPMPAVAYRGSYRPLRKSGWVAGRHFQAGDLVPPEGAQALLTLDRNLADRLVATVVGTWAQRVADADPRVPDARPALQAAVYGRAARAVRAWLGDPARPVDLRLLAPGEPPRVVSGATGEVRLGLGVGWLRDVWVPGLATAFGRLCLDAERVTNTSWSLLTVGPDLDDPRVMTVTW